MEYLALFEDASRLRRARIDGMRAELAATLVDGAPCPVCGSLDHPELCELRGERVTREQEEEADAEAAQASERAETIGARLGAADVRVSDLTARLESDGFAVAADLISLQADAARLKAAARERRARTAELAAAAARHGELQAALEALDQAIADTGKHLAELTEQREADLRQAAEADLRAGRHRESLLSQLDGQPDLDSALSAARQAADALIAAADAADATMRARDDARRAGDLAAQAAAEAGFADLEAARDARRDAPWRATADQDIREHEASVQGRRRAARRPRPRCPARPARRPGRCPGGGRGSAPGPRRRGGRLRPGHAQGRTARRPRPTARRARWTS